jgi:hypothetical protein
LSGLSTERIVWICPSRASSAKVLITLPSIDVAVPEPVEEPRRQFVAFPPTAAGSSLGSVSSGSGNHCPTYFSRWTRAERSTSIETRVTTAERNALVDAGFVGMTRSAAGRRTGHRA